MLLSPEVQGVEEIHALRRELTAIAGRPAAPICEQWHAADSADSQAMSSLSIWRLEYWRLLTRINWFDMGRTIGARIGHI
jgi:hypothetical protein